MRVTKLNIPRRKLDHQEASMKSQYVPNISTVERKKVSGSFADGFWGCMGVRAALCFILINAQESLMLKDVGFMI
jgi:hypothetical protein